MTDELKTGDLARADQIAKENDHSRMMCDMCSGRGIAGARDMNSDGHVRWRDPCESCEGYGVIWIPESSDPAIPPPMGKMNYSEVMALGQDEL